MKTKVSTGFAFSVIVLLSVFFGVVTWFVAEEVIDADQSIQPFTDHREKKPVRQTDDASSSTQVVAPNGTVVFEDVALGLRFTAHDDFSAEPLVETICPYTATKAYDPTSVILLSKGQLRCGAGTMSKDSTGYYLSQDQDVILIYSYDLKKCQDKTTDTTEKKACATYAVQAKIGDHAFVESESDTLLGTGYWVKTNKDTVVFIDAFVMGDAGQSTLRDVTKSYRVWVNPIDTTGTTSSAPGVGHNPFVSACADDTRQCPDGSSVSRDNARNCDFSPCPTKKVGAVKPDARSISAPIPVQ